MPAGKVVFFSSCPEPWGGSEELWSGAAVRLRRSGHQILLYKTLVEYDHPRIKSLIEAGITVEDFYRTPPVNMQRARRIANRVLPHRYRLKMGYGTYEACVNRVRAGEFDYAIIAQGENFDGLPFVQVCHELKLPYFMICQKASDQNWPPDNLRGIVRHAYNGAIRSFFVSEHNLKLTQEQIGADLVNAEVVRNPYLTQISGPVEFPLSADGVYRLACVGRLFVAEKGQDILLRVLAMDKWRNRPIHVSFFGKGCHSDALQDFARDLGLVNVCFCGFSNNVTEIWNDHHALVLASRAEGLPLVVVESMMCGRLAIVTNVGGNTEVIDDNVTGFIADGACVASFDQALERSWVARERWQEMGIEAARRIRTMVSDDPCGYLAARLIELSNKAIGQTHS